MAGAHGVYAAEILAQLFRKANNNWDTSIEAGSSIKITCIYRVRIEISNRVLCVFECSIRLVRIVRLGKIRGKLYAGQWPASLEDKACES
jgi:hypothetical protein